LEQQRAIRDDGDRHLRLLVLHGRSTRTVTYPLGSGSIVGSLLGSVLGLVQGLTSGSGLADGTFNVTATAMDIAARRARRPRH